MATELLTALKIAKTKPAEKPVRLFDGGGLYLLIEPSGARYWRFKYRFQGKEKLLSLGVYPEVSLAEAREKLRTERKRLASGVDPSRHRRDTREAAMRAEADRKGNTFEVIAREWFDQARAEWSEQHCADVLGKLETNVFPHIGQRPIREITGGELYNDVLKRIIARKKQETARRVRQICGQVFRYAITTSRADADPSAHLKDATKRSSKSVKHRAAVTDPDAFGEMLRTLDDYTGSPIVAAALKLAPLVVVRPGELRKAEWSEIDLDAALWTIAGAKMKTGHDHTVPLSRQAVAILRELQPITMHSRFVFPSRISRSKPMSENAVLVAMRSLGIDKETATGHGFRASFRTIADEVLGFRVDWVEHQLAHAVRDVNGRSYNRTSFLPQRADMMQRWADVCEALKAGKKIAAAPAPVVEFTTAAAAR